MKSKIKQMLKKDQRLTDCNFPCENEFVFAVVNPNLSATPLVRGRVTELVDGLDIVRVSVFDEGVEIKGIVDHSTGVARWKAQGSTAV